jgi:hypothetical protein
VARFIVHETGVRRHLAELLFDRLKSLSKPRGFLLDRAIGSVFAFVDHHPRKLLPIEASVYPQNEQSLIVERELLAQLGDARLGFGSRRSKGLGADFLLHIVKSRHAGDGLLSPSPAMLIGDVPARGVAGQYVRPGSGGALPAKTTEAPP